jgi:type IV pilus assembly protein PilQ
MKLKPILMLITMLLALGLAGMTALSHKAPAPEVSFKVAAGPRPAGNNAGVKEETLSVPAASSAHLASLTGISIQPAADGNGTSIDISTTQSTPYRVLHLTDPNRLVLDLEGARNATHRWKYSSDSPCLSRIRLGRYSEEYGGVVRVVADLEGNPVCNVRKEATGFHIELEPRGEVEGGAVPPGSHAEAVSVKVPSATESAVNSHLTEPDIPKVKENPRPQSPIKLSMRAERTQTGNPGAWPAASSFPKRAAASKSPVNSVPTETAQAAKAAEVMAGTANTSPKISRAQGAGEGGASKEKSLYTGEAISLNLKDVDLKDFFRLIHEISGLNIIVDPNVSGTVTLVLDNVPWDQALDIVLKNNGLGDQLEGNVLRIAKMSTLVAEQQDEQKFSVAKEETAPLATVFRPINYAKAATIASLLKSWVGGGALSRRGSVLVDDRTNTLIISDIQTQIPAIESVINKLDKKAQQVSIEARIIRATSDFARNLSTALSFAQRNPSGSMVTGGATGTGVSGQPLSPPPVTTSPATGFGVFVLSNLGANYAINAAIAAAESHDEAKTISRPSIVTQNNIQGTVVQGTQIPIQTTINNTISIQYVQASLQLQVTPQVTDDGHVFLTINIQNSSPGPALTLAGPTINTQSATTEVLVPNGGTVVFGGVTVTTRSKSSTGVPLLGSIPILGHLFKSTVDQKNDQELLFFVTPKVLPT